MTPKRICDGIGESVGVTPKRICDGIGESEGVGDCAGAVGVKSLVLRGRIANEDTSEGGWMLPVVEVVQ